MRRVETSGEAERQEHKNWTVMRFLLDKRDAWEIIATWSKGESEAQAWRNSAAAATLALNYCAMNNISISDFIVWMAFQARGAAISRRPIFTDYHNARLEEIYIDAIVKQALAMAEPEAIFAYREGFTSGVWKAMYTTGYNVIDILELIKQAEPIIKLRKAEPPRW